MVFYAKKWKFTVVQMWHLPHTYTCSNDTVQSTSLTSSSDDITLKIIFSSSWSVLAVHHPRHTLAIIIGITNDHWSLQTSWLKAAHLSSMWSNILARVPIYQAGFKLNLIKFYDFILLKKAAHLSSRCSILARVPIYQAGVMDRKCHH